MVTRRPGPARAHDREWAHLGYLSACEAALQGYGVETAAIDADAGGVRKGSIEVLVLGPRGWIEPLDLGWSEEYGWGYSRRTDSDRARASGDAFFAAEPADRDAGPHTGRPEAYTHGQFGGGVLPDPEHFAALVVRVAAGEQLADHLPGEPLAYRSAGDDDGFTALLSGFGPA
jgi:hypothetical protein